MRPAGAGAAAPSAQRPCAVSPHCRRAPSTGAAHGAGVPRRWRRQRGAAAVPRATGAGDDDSGDVPPAARPPTPNAAAAAQPLPAVGDAVGAVQYGGTLPSRRRFFLGTTAAAAVALGGNLLGVTSALLSSSPETAAAARRARLDVIFPVEGQLRFFDESLRFEFAYPRQWMGDVTVARRRAERQERERERAALEMQGLPSLRPRRLPSLSARGGGGDPLAPLASSSPSSFSPPPAVEPAAAFGPPGSTGEENVSVVVAPILPGFSLAQLGAPGDAARRFLDATVAPPGSGRTAELVSASAGPRLTGDPGVLYYTFEFGVRSPTFERRNVSVLAARGDRLFTLNTQAPESLWARDGALLRRTAASFVLY